jgi:uncharacterized protein YlxW (UPF0749 family)
MNQFTKKTNPSEAETATGRTQTPWVAGLIFKMAMIMSIIFAAFYARVHLNDKTEQLAREKSRITEEIQEKRTEIRTLVAKRETLRSWDNINAKIRQYNLALRAVNPSQVRYMKRFEGQVAGPATMGSDTRVADTSAVAGQASGGTY